MKKAKWAKLPSGEFEKRLTALESVYTQKQLSSMLGVSVRSLNYYQKGESFPRSKEVYQKINSLYHTRKAKITPEQVQSRIKKRTTLTQAETLGRLKWRTVPIYPDYMVYSPTEYFSGVLNWDWLEEMSENGYVAGYYGRNAIPMEVQFLIHGEGQKRFGRVVRMVGIWDRSGSPKKENNFSGHEISLTVEPAHYLLIPTLKRTMSFEERTEAIRAYFFSREIDKKLGIPMAYLGFYFNESDEVF